MTDGIKDFFSNLKWFVPTNSFGISDFIQIVIIFFVLYYIIKTLQGTRAWVILKGLLIVLFVYMLVSLTSLSVIQFMMEQVFSIIVIAVVIMFQPELRRILENIGKKDIQLSIFKRIYKKDKKQTYFSKKTIDEIVISCAEMSKTKTGALLVFERDIPLIDYIKSGIDLNATISNQLILNMFEKNTPLHDGAAIIKDNEIKAATCYLPLSDNSNIAKTLGTRHRAGIGITEVTDAFVITVSEETGSISWCENGKIKHNVTIKELTNKLFSIQEKKVIDLNKKKNFSFKRFFTKVAVAFTSVLLWAMVLNINDEVKVVEYNNIPVHIINENALNEIDQAYEIVDGATVSVSIKGKRSILEHFDKNDIYVYADFEELSMVYAVPINAKIINNNNLVEIVDISKTTMKLELEEIVEFECPIVVNMVGEKLDDKYVKIEETTPKVLKIVGPKSKVSILDKALASAQPTLYDKNGNVVDKNNLLFNYDIVNVNAIVYDTKQIPLNVFLEDNFTNNKTNYYELLSYEIENEYISISSDNETLNRINQIDVPITLNDNNDTISSVLINLENYLPENVYLANNQEKQIQISLELNKYTHKEISISEKDIKILSLDDNYELQLEAYPNSISLLVNEKVVTSNVDLEFLNPVIKVETNEKGNYSTELRLKEIDGVLINSNLNVMYSLSEKSKNRN